MDSTPSDYSLQGVDLLLVQFPIGRIQLELLHCSITADVTVHFGRDVTVDQFAIVEAEQTEEQWMRTEQVLLVVTEMGNTDWISSDKGR